MDEDITVRASAPGKVVLSGEYAVLAGAPALVAAVNRRVTCTLTPRESGDWHFVSTGFKDDITLAKEEVFHAPPESLAGVVRQVIDESAAPAHLQIGIDSSPCYSKSVKLGLGSSAATVVAVAAAFAALAGSTPKLADLMAIHAAFQGGGSGLDVAASVTGGVIRFQERQARPASMPAGLPMLFVFCGRGTRTSDLLARFDHWRQGGQPRVLKRLVQSAWDVADRTDDLPSFVEALDEYAYALERLDQVADIGIFGTAHRELRELAVQTGVTYKPCGAGGDDIGMAVAADDDALSKFRERVCNHAAANARFEIIDLEVSPGGPEVQTVNIAH